MLAVLAPFPGASTSMIDKYNARTAQAWRGMPRTGQVLNACQVLNAWRKKLRLIRFFILPMMIMVVIGLCSCASGNGQATPDSTKDPVIHFPAADEPWETTRPEDEAWDTEALEKVFEFARRHHSSGLVIIKNGQVLAQRKWPLENPPVAGQVSYRDIWYHGDSPNG